LFFLKDLILFAKISAVRKILFILIFTASLFSEAKSLKIIDSETKNGVPFALIEISDLNIQSRSDSNGVFQLNIVLPRNTYITVSSSGYVTKNVVIDNPTTDFISIELTKSHILLNEVIISSTTGIVQQHNLSNVFVKKISNRNQIQSANLIGMLSTVPGVYSVNTGTGISKPVIRGMSGLKIVTYLNGLRIENQQWANDHGISFGEMGIENVEIIKGPSSLLYGADALGGVLYFVDEHYTSPNTFVSSFKSQFETNSLSTNNVATVKLSSENLRLNVYAGYKNCADYQIPNGSYVVNSRYEGKSFKTSLGFNKQNWILNLRYNYISNRIGLPGHTHEADPSPSDFQSNLQNRKKIIPLQLITDHYLSLENKIFIKNSVLKLQTGFTSNDLTEHEEKVTIPGIKMLLKNIPYNLTFKSNLTEDIKWILGTQGMYQTNTNDKTALNTLIPNSCSIDKGAFALLHYSKSLFEWQLGVRYDNRKINADNILNKSFSKMNGSFGIVYGKNNYTFRTNITSGFRPPHLSEMLANGVHHGTNRYEIGSKDLVSELGNQFDLSLDYNTAHLELCINPFLNVFKNYIYLKPTNDKINDYPVYEYSQASSAKTYGGEFYVHYHPHFAHRIHIEQDVSYIIGKDNQDRPLPLIPQTRINTNLKYEFDKKTNNKLQIETLILQRTQFLAKNDVSTYENASKNYETYNLEANFSHEGKLPVFLKLGIRNLFNVEYINHLSNLKGIGIPNPGINFYFSLNFYFRTPKS